MILKDILNGVSGTLLQGDLQQEINSITIDSRKTESNVLFVAIKGMKVDGHSFIGGAYEKGCRAVIVEEDVENLPQDMTVYKVSESREALTVIAGNFYEHPSKKLNMIGVTGTNGKTSTTYFMESILNTIGHKTGVIGTVETRIGGKKRDIKFATSTTPDTLDLNAILKLMADENVEDLVMEVSSHGLALNNRHGGLRADIAQTQDRAAVGDDGHRVRLQRVVVGRLGILGDDLAGLGDAGRVGHGQIMARGDIHLRIEGELAAPFGVLGERFRCDIHRFQVLRTISPV